MCDQCNTFLPVNAEEVESVAHLQGSVVLILCCQCYSATSSETESNESDTDKDRRIFEAKVRSIHYICYFDKEAIFF